MHIDCEHCGKGSPLDSKTCVNCAEPFRFLEFPDSLWEPQDYSMWLYSQHFQIYEKCLAQGLDALSRDERLNYLVGYLYYQVHNGGVWQYMTNPCGEDAPLLAEALIEIGATQTAAAIKECLALFPGGAPSSRQDERDEAVDAIPDDLADELADKVSSLVCEQHSPEDLVVLLRKAIRKGNESVGNDR